MGGAAKKPEYTGIHKYPGWIATVITFIVGGIFIGALVWTGSHGHGDHHGEGHGTEAHGADHKEGEHKEGEQKAKDH